MAIVGVFIVLAGSRRSRRRSALKEQRAGAQGGRHSYTPAWGGGRAQHQFRCSASWGSSPRCTACTCVRPAETDEMPAGRGHRLHRRRRGLRDRRHGRARPRHSPRWPAPACSDRRHGRLDAAVARQLRRRRSTRTARWASSRISATSWTPATRRWKRRQRGDANARAAAMEGPARCWRRQARRSDGTTPAVRARHVRGAAEEEQQRRETGRDVDGPESLERRTAMAPTRTSSSRFPTPAAPARPPRPGGMGRHPGRDNDSETERTSKVDGRIAREGVEDRRQQRPGIVLGDRFVVSASGRGGDRRSQVRGRGLIQRLESMKDVGVTK